jgi:hypothetical protein
LGGCILAVVILLCQLINPYCAKLEQKTQKRRKSQNSTQIAIWRMFDKSSTKSEKKHFCVFYAKAGVNTNIIF